MKQTLFFPPSCVASSFGEKVGLGSQTLGSWAFCLGKVDSSGALDKGGREREKAGERIFFTALQSVFPTHLFGGTSFQQCSQLSHRQRPRPLGGFPFCLNLEFTLGPSSADFKGSQPLRGPRTLYICSLLNSECVLLKLQ